MGIVRFYKYMNRQGYQRVLCTNYKGAGGFKLFFSPNLSWTPLFTEGGAGLRGEKAVAGVFVWKLGILTPPTLLQIVMMEAYFLTPIYTLPEKRRLISDRMKGPPVAALRSPLMKALDGSVGTLGL